MPELLVEFFSEEIPARMQLRAAEDLKNLAAEHLAAAGFADLQMDSYVTPRRLVFVVHNLPIQQPDRSEEIKGPRVDAPEQALNGFMQANNLISLNDIEKREIGKGTHYFITQTTKGLKTSEVLEFIILRIFAQFTWPKSMRWGNSMQVWVRPLQQANVVFDGKVIMGSGEFYGHRFLSPRPFKANSFDQYKGELKKNYVILDQRERRDEILTQVGKLAAEQKLSLHTDDAFEKLLNEVTGLVEWPTAMLGTFEAEYLAVPQECLIATMRANQKYFPLFDDMGKLANDFIVIANVPGVNGGKEIIAGNERVLRARLSDAKFFYDQDLKTRLDSRIEKLKTIQFHEKLGTLYEKTARVADVAKKLAIALNADEKLTVRAAQLCKADLVSGMVGEFPELQGIMGRYYALADGEDAAVAEAIRDHYQPLGPTAAVPCAPVSIIVALADKLDTLNEFFRIGEKPTGSKDPYALRRAALGVIRIILENKIQLPLSQFVRPDVLEFIKDRLQVVLRDQNITLENIQSAMSNILDNVYLIAKAAKDSDKFWKTAAGIKLGAIRKRALNILEAEERKDKVQYNGIIKVNLLVEDVEKLLAAELNIAAEKLIKAFGERNHSAAEQILIQLEPFLDRFFEQVMVNASETGIRVNRLNLLSKIRSLFQQFSNFSQLEG